DPAALGKSLFADLREGKMSWPLIVAIERDPELLALVEDLLAAGGDQVSPSVGARVLASLARSGALDDCRALARERAAQAVEAIAVLPAGAARAALETVAAAGVSREGRAMAG